MAPFLLPILGFFLGSIPFGFLLCLYVHNTDVRKQGSGNMGAANVARNFGMKSGLVTLFFDAVKGALPVWISLLEAPNSWVPATTAVAAVLGHCFSPWMRFRGGKGVATALGVFGVLLPVPVLAGVVAYAGTFVWKKIASLSSLVGVSMFALAAMFVSGMNLPVIASVVVVVVLIFVRHRTNLQKLSRGEEKQLRFQESEE